MSSRRRRSRSRSRSQTRRIQRRASSPPKRSRSRRSRSRSREKQDVDRREIPRPPHSTNSDNSSRFPFRRNKDNRPVIDNRRRINNNRHRPSLSPQPPVSDNEEDLKEEWDDNWGLGKRAKPDYNSSGDELIEEDVCDLEKLMGFGAFDTTKTKDTLEKIVLSGSISEKREKERETFEERKFERMYGGVQRNRFQQKKSFSSSSSNMRHRRRSRSRSRSPYRGEKRPGQRFRYGYCR